MTERLVPVGDLAISSSARNERPIEAKGELERAPAYVPVGRAVANAVGRFIRLGAPPEWLRAPEVKP